MKVLYITNMFPSDKDPYYGIFVKEQVNAIKKNTDLDEYVYVINGKKGIMEYFKSMFAIRKILKKQAFDLIHIHYGLSGLFLLLFCIKIPVILTLHGGDILTEQGKNIQVLLTKMILKKCDFVITLNDKMDFIAKQYCPNTAIIPCSVNTGLFHNYRDKNIRSNIIKVLFPSSRDRYVKDYPLFHQVCELLRKGAKLEIAEYYLENLTRGQVADLFNKMDLLLMTSISEGSPQVVKEAMACDLPIVSTDVGDVHYLLQGVNRCYVAKNRDAKELASLVLRSLSCNQTHGLSPREKILKLKLDDDSIASQIIKLYKRVLFDLSDMRMK